MKIVVIVPGLGMLILSVYAFVSAARTMEPAQISLLAGVIAIACFTLGVAVSRPNTQEE